MAMDKNVEFTINGNSTPRQTNYDRIKSMSVEDMAEFLVKCDGDMQGTTKKENQDEARDIQQWLLQEVSEDDTERKES